MTKTQKIRTKRPDGRAVSAQRRRSGVQSVCAKETIEDIRVTTSQSRKKEREVDSTMPLRKSRGEKRLDELQKQIRNIRKKLLSIEALMEKQAEGAELNEDQMLKIESMDDILFHYMPFSLILVTISFPKLAIICINNIEITTLRPRFRWKKRIHSCLNKS